MEVEAGPMDDAAHIGGSQDGDSTAHMLWAENRLPGSECWGRLEWQTVIRHTQETFVQIPDRFRGAVFNARGKVLEVLKEARARGPAESEWKTFLLLDSLLVCRDRSNATCSESLEERLAWWWGGQSAAAKRL